MQLIVFLSYSSPALVGVFLKGDEATDRAMAIMLTGNALAVFQRGLIPIRKGAAAMAGVAPQYGFHFQVWALAVELIRSQERDGAFMGA